MEITTTPVEPNRVGSRINAFLLASGLNKSEAARRSNLYPPAISRLCDMDQSSSPSLSTLLKLRNGLGITLDQMTGDRVLPGVDIPRDQTSIEVPCPQTHDGERLVRAIATHLNKHPDLELIPHLHRVLDYHLTERSAMFEALTYE